MKILGIIGFFVSIFVFIRDILLRNECGEFVILKINNNNINCFETNKKNGYYLTRFNIDLKIIKSNIYNIKLSYINGDVFSKNSNFTNKKEGDDININLVSEKETNILIDYEDKYNNKYYQNIILTPVRYYNGTINTFVVKISNRKWGKYWCNNIIKKFIR